MQSLCMLEPDTTAYKTKVYIFRHAMSECLHSSSDFSFLEHDISLAFHQHLPSKYGV